MPLWRIFYPSGLYSVDEKKSLAQAITGIYTAKSGANLPDFYVNVVFVEYQPGEFFVGGEPVKDFVRFCGEHIARQMAQDETARMRGFMSRLEEAVAPWTSGKSVRWETHVDQTPFDLWRVSGLPPPPPNSDAERLWKEQGAAVPYQGMVSTASPAASGTTSTSSAEAKVLRESSGLIGAQA